MVLILSWSTGVLLAFFVVVLTLIFNDMKKKDSKKAAPGPRQWPIIGSIPFMAKYTNPVDAFSALNKQYGDIVTLKLGGVNTMVVSGLDNLRQILVTRAQFFDSRPGFQRYHMLFENNKDNSMAFSDWSEGLRKKREMIGHHTFPKIASTFFQTFSEVASAEVTKMMETLKSTVAQTQTENQGVALKPVFLDSTFKIFMKYFCNLEINETNEKEAEEVVQCFDDVFQEVNAQCVGDLFPILMPICGKSHLRKFGEVIRGFTMKQCVEPRLEAIKQASSSDDNNNVSSDKADSLPTDLLGEFLDSVGKSEDMTLHGSLFALEDILGGHSAISNFLTTVIVFLARNPAAQAKVRQEVAEVFGTDSISLERKLPYSESVIWESARSLSSPLVPHVANCDTHLGDFPVKKGTIFFLNNVDLNYSPDLWTEPEKFIPERFLTEENRVLKPDYFLPFGTGRRSCLGFKVLLYTSMLTVSNLCSNFEISLDATESYSVGLGTLAVPGAGFRLRLTPINN